METQTGNFPSLFPGNAPTGMKSLKQKWKMLHFKKEEEALDGENGLLYYSHVQTESKCEAREIK